MKQSTKTTSMISILLSLKGARRLHDFTIFLPPGVWVRSVMLGVWDHEDFREDPVEIPYTNSERRHKWCNCFFLEIPAGKRSHIPFHTFEHDFSNFSSLLGYGYPLPRGFAPKLKLISQGRPPWTVDPHIFCNVGGSSLRLMYTSLQAHSEIYIVFVEISPRPINMYDM